MSNEKMREALRSIANSTCCGRCQEAALVARAALAAQRQAEPVDDGDYYSEEADDIAKSRRRAVVTDAQRYRSFFSAGLPITFLGVDYRTKEELDAAIDAAMQKETK